MPSANIGSVVAQFRAQNQQFLKASRQNIDALRKQQRAFKENARAAQRNTPAFANLAKSMNGFAIASAASAASLVLLGRAFINGAKRAAQFGAELIENSRRTGLQVEQLQLLGSTFEADGASLETFLRGYKTFQRAIQDGQDGLSTQVRAFRRLGIEVNSIQFSLLSAEQQLSAVNQGLQGLSQTAQSATLQQLFGRAGFQLAPTLTQSPEAFRAEQERQQRLLPPLTTEQAQAQKDLLQSFTDLNNVVRNRVNRAFADLAPALERLANSLVVFGGLFGQILNSLTAPFRAVDFVVGLAEDIVRASTQGYQNIADLIATQLEGAVTLEEAGEALKESALSIARTSRGREGFTPVQRTNFIADIIDVFDEWTGNNRELIRELRDSVPESPLERFNPIELLMRSIRRTELAGEGAGIQGFGDTIIEETATAVETLGKLTDRYNRIFAESIDNLTRINNAQRLNIQLDNAPDALTRSQIRFDNEFGGEEEFYRDTIRSTEVLIEELNRLLGLGILSADQERVIRSQVQTLIQNNADLEKTYSQSANTLKRLLLEEEKFVSEQFRLAALTTAAQDAFNASVQTTVDGLIARRQRAEDQIANLQATTRGDQIAAQLRPYIRDYDARIAENRRLAREAQDRARTATGEEAILTALGQASDFNRAADQAEAARDVNLQRTTILLGQAIDAENELATARDNLAQSTEGANAAGRQYIANLEGFDFEGFLRNNNDFVKRLREQNEEIGLQEVELQGLRAQREAQNFINQEANRLNDQLARSQKNLNDAIASGDATAIEAAQKQLDLAKQLNDEFVRRLGLLNEIVEQTVQRTEAEAQAGETARLLQTIAEDAGRAFGRFTGDVLRNFDSIDDAARRLGQSILDNIINNLIIDPASDFFTKAILSIFGGGGSAGSVPQLQQGGLGRGLTLVGEAGPELVDFRNPGRVYSNAALSSALSGSGRGDIVFAPVIQSSDTAAVNRALAEAFPIFERRVISTIQQDSRRPSGVRQDLRGY